MWDNLHKDNKDEYKNMILAFASLTEVFSQKSDNDSKNSSPIINSKYQETVFQRTFNAVAEDIGNTSYDASICQTEKTGEQKKYLIGIKTFGINSKYQKVAQFKRNHDEWATIISDIRTNANAKTETEINAINEHLYLKLAKKISVIRNKRIASSIANLKGFSVANNEADPESVYHVLMPSKKGDKPTIAVGETTYDMIDIDNIRIIGCTSKTSPTNFDFTDGNHIYRYTSADSQLLMEFNNENIVKEKWDVIYIEDAYSVFSKLASDIYGKKDVKADKQESYSWLITNRNGEMELFSGFNSFFAVGSKMAQTQRKNAIDKLMNDFKGILSNEFQVILKTKLEEFLIAPAPTDVLKQEKVNLRQEIIDLVDSLNIESLKERVFKLLFSRPKNEMYIPIPHSIAFHRAHPNFFSKEIKSIKNTNKALVLNKDKTARAFNLIFEPSGKKIRSYVCQDGGKAIESVDKQTIMGEWILREVFQLKDYEPLTTERLNELEINGIRLWKNKESDDIHLSFIWIDKDKKPADYWHVK